MASNCHSDADCGPSGFCSPSMTSGSCQSYVDGYADCVADDIGYALCAYRPERGHWVCVLGAFCAG